jgi:hypothetical protein
MHNLASKFNLTHGAPALTPVHVAAQSFIPNKGESTLEETLLYQQKVGSSIYLTVIIRPNTAYATGLLTRFLQNSAPEYLVEINHLICYLRDTKDYAIEYSADAPVWDAAVYSAHADDKATMHLTHEWIISMFGDPIDWKSGR